MDEAKEKSQGSAPDLSSSSMAYMPKSKSAPEEDNELRIDKKAEKKTLADLPDQLEADTDTASDGIKVMVNGKPKAEVPVKSKPEPDAKPAAVSETETHHAHVAPTQLHPDEAKAMVQPKVTAEHEPKSKSGKGAMMLAGLLLIVAIGVGYMYYAARAQVTKLNNELQQANSDKDALKAQVSTAPSEEASALAVSGDTSDKRSIPEIGLYYKLTSSSSRVTYAYSENQDGAGAAHSVVSFSSTSLIAAERKVLKAGAAATCAANAGPLGSLTSYKGAESVEGVVSGAKGKFSDLKVDNKTTFKLGETYYVFASPQQQNCSTNSDVAKVQATDRTLISELLTTLSVK